MPILIPGRRPSSSCRLRPEALALLVALFSGSEQTQAPPAAPVALTVDGFAGGEVARRLAGRWGRSDEASGIARGSVPTVGVDAERVALGSHHRFSAGFSFTPVQRPRIERSERAERTLAGRIIRRGAWRGAGFA